jgi:acetyl/propionyl-CoA carboxylase alpha subunit
VDSVLRERLCAAAIAAANAVGYTSCGTVEFLLAPDGSFYFLEMNTRLQVEHPVTEEVWGVDLAREMIAISLGEPLSFRLEDLAPRGHAIECRIYAEDPLAGFAPSPGVVTALRLPEGPGVRNDTGIEAGFTVSIDYDPMLGKLIVHGATRAAALERLGRALAEYEVSGVATTLPLFRALLDDPEFLRAAFDVQWLDPWLAAGRLAEAVDGPSGDEVLFTAAGLARMEGSAAIEPERNGSLWRRVARSEALRKR